MVAQILAVLVKGALSEPCDRGTEPEPELGYETAASVGPERALEPEPEPAPYESQTKCVAGPDAHTRTPSVADAEIARLREELDALKNAHARELATLRREMQAGRP